MLDLVGIGNCFDHQLILRAGGLNGDDAIIQRRAEKTAGFICHILNFEKVGLRDIAIEKTFLINVYQPLIGDQTKAVRVDKYDFENFSKDIKSTDQRDEIEKSSERKINKNHGDDCQSKSRF